MPMHRDIDNPAARRVAWHACLALILGALLAGCTTTPIPPPYTAAELAWKCERTGGWWRPHISGGYCEYEAPMR
jgi:hypothetical protein